MRGRYKENLEKLLDRRTELLIEKTTKEKIAENMNERLKILSE